MLPKVATHILHTTSRAAASIHHQTHTLRNVLQLQSSSTTSSNSGNITPWNGPGSSHWSNNGPGPGGAKYNAGNRFHNGFTGVGRAVTQANALSHSDGSYSQSDDAEELPRRAPASHPKRARIRSHSLSMQSHPGFESNQKFGILKTVQLQAQSRRFFTHAELVDTSNSSPDLIFPSSEKVRRNSISASSPTSTVLDASVPPLPPTRRNSTSASTSSRIDFSSYSPSSPSASSVNTNLPDLTSGKEHSAEISPACRRLWDAYQNGDASEVIEGVRSLRQSDSRPSAREYSLAIEALCGTRRPGESMRFVLETYNDMLQHSVMPTEETYIRLILALTDRDFELQNIIRKHENQVWQDQLLDVDEGDRRASNPNIADLLSETNFENAMSLFEILTGLKRRYPISVCHSLLRSCALRGNVESAIHVFAQLESRADIAPTLMVYKYLLETYMKAGRVNGAEDVFNDFLRRSQAGIISKLSPGNSPATQLQIWNQMIRIYFLSGSADKAVDLVDKMMNTRAGVHYLLKDTPPPASSTFAAVLSGFCHIGDLTTALTWFDRLLQQEHTTSDPYEVIGGGIAMRPDASAWMVVLEALAAENMVDDLNKYYRVLSDSSYLHADSRIQSMVKPVVFHANITRLASMTTDQAKQVLDFLVNDVIPIGTPNRRQAKMLSCVWQAYLALGFPLHDCPIIKRYEYGPSLLQAYLHLREQGRVPQLQLTHQDWALLLQAAMDTEPLAEKERRAIVSETSPVLILRDISQLGIAFGEFEPSLLERIRSSLLTRYGTEGLSDLVAELGPSFSCLLTLAMHKADSPMMAESVSDSASASPADLVIDHRHTRSMENILIRNAIPSQASAIKAYRMFFDGIERGVAPTETIISRLLQALGRCGEIDKVWHVYNTSQLVLQSLENAKKWQERAWHAIEDAMIIALTAVGDMESAHVHRARLLAQGGAPSADAYACLIHHVRDTTDDASAAMALFHESQVVKVRPNQYLYNNIISKLAKARKADYALELFQQMKTAGIPPSSITYGAVIGACARVGDVQSAEALFNEMTQAANFKPRVPPYNTMMQLFTTTKPNRERALYYYEELLKAGVSPTAHTYKLLMDAYGVVEPVDPEEMEQVFRELQADPSVEPQGVHFATLINAYGCVQKNLSKAIEIFESIESHGLKPDAVVFEAIINVLVAHRRTDLIPDFVSRMNSAGVHMTAYIANFLIKGYANVGDLEHARNIFESLLDPPEGIAAPNNHSPHESGVSSSVDYMEPVYREPSTWEVMIRTELGSGNREKALDLLERLKARKYPDAVYNRISGIMIDHSMVMP